jgi:lysophospholipase L1-like esterase
VILAPHLNGLTKKELGLPHWDRATPRQQRDGIVANNAVMARLAGERGIAFVDIFDISSRAAEDRSLVADDGLHPSGAQYALWVERIAPVVAESLSQ